MILYVNGQDIARFVLGVVGMDNVEVVEAGPDQFLACVRNFLAKHQATLNDVETIVCVRGPGSATALRVSLSIVQTLAFARDIKLVGIEKDPAASDQELFGSITHDWLLEHPVEDRLVPLYLHAPQITASARDHLKRPL